MAVIFYRWITWRPAYDRRDNETVLCSRCEQAALSDTLRRTGIGASLFNFVIGGKKFSFIKRDARTKMILIKIFNAIFNTVTHLKLSYFTFFSFLKQNST